MTSTRHQDEHMPLWAWVLVEMDDPRARYELRSRLARLGVRRQPLRLAPEHQTQHQAQHQTRSESRTDAGPGA